jgi:hypothetical protein
MYVCYKHLLILTTECTQVVRQEASEGDCTVIEETSCPPARQTVAEPPAEFTANHSDLLGRQSPQSPPDHANNPHQDCLLSLPLQAQLIDWAHNNTVREAKKKVERGAARKAETRTTWTHEAKVLVVKAVEECGGILSGLRELKNIRMMENSADVFATISRDMVRKWRNALSNNEDLPFAKRGRKVEEEFEAEVLSKIIFVGVDRAAGPDGACGNLQVLANVAFSYDCVKGAAQQVQKSDRWIHKQCVQNLTFSRGWIAKFMARFTLRRRVITNKDKPRPSQEEVQARMSQIQSDMDEHDAQKNFIFNGDETGVWYGILPSYIYVPDGTQRGSAPASDDRARITAFLYGLFTRARFARTRVYVLLDGKHDHSARSCVFYVKT